MMFASRSVGDRHNPVNPYLSQYRHVSHRLAPAAAAELLMLLDEHEAADHAHKVLTRLAALDHVSR